MKKMLLFIVLITVCNFASNQASASAVDDGVNEKNVSVKISAPLNAEAEKIYRDILDFNEDYKQAEEGKKTVPNSKVLDVIEEGVVEYTTHLKQILPKVETSTDADERKKLVTSAARKLDPSSFYY